MPDEPSSPRVLVIGLDGATFRIMRPLLDAGKLPVLGKLIAQGASGVLTSTIPPHSSVAWPSFASGKNPGKHGVFYVLNPIPGSYERRLINSQSIRALTLWQLLSMRDRRVGVIDVPITFPVRPVNGFLVSGMLTPSEESICTYPDSLHMELVMELGDFPIEATMIPAAVRQGPVACMRAIHHYAETRRRAALYLMRTRPWDFFCLVFRGVDSVQHLMWRYMQEELRPLHPELSRKFERVIDQFYIRMDEAVGQLMEEAGPDVTTIIMSDHGMGPCRRNFYINRWLEEHGFLSRIPGSVWRSRRPRIRRRTALPPVPAGQPASRVRRWLGATPLFLPELEYLGRHREVDWSRTRAYANWTGGESMISVNLRGREPQGIVSAGAEYDKVCEEVTRQLLELRDPWDGGPVVEKVYRRDEIYQGPYVEEAPDLHLLPREFMYHARGEVRAPSVLERATHRAPSLHDPEGVVVLHGPAVAPGAELQGARIIDIAPTVLHLMGLPVPDDMDGAVLESALHSDYRNAHPVTREPASTWAGEKARVYSDDEQQAVMDTLRGLGYVS